MFGYFYFNGDKFQPFRPSSDHLTENELMYMQCNQVVWDPIILRVA